MDRKIALLLIGILLTACSQTQNKQPELPKPNQSPSVYKYSNHTLSIDVPSAFTFQQADNDGQFYGYDKQHGDFSIQIYKPAPSSHCQNLGASHPDITEDKTQGIRSVQGYVDYFDTMDTPVGNPDPPCRPPGGKDSAAYVFCSEKDGKQVVICISQQTANLALAQKIFSTFQWTDQ